MKNFFIKWLQHPECLSRTNPCNRFEFVELIEPLHVIRVKRNTHIANFAGAVGEEKKRIALDAIGLHRLGVSLKLAFPNGLLHDGVFELGIDLEVGTAPGSDQ